MQPRGLKSVMFILEMYDTIVPFAKDNYMCKQCVTFEVQFARNTHMFCIAIKK